MMNSFLAWDAFLDYAYESAKLWDEWATGRVFRRFYGEMEKEIPPSSDLYNQAIAAGTMIFRKDYFRD